MIALQPTDALGSLIRETFSAMARKVEHQFDDTEIVLSQWLTLNLAGAGAIQCVGDVNRELGLDSGAATRLIDQLENRGWLCRTRSLEDRRVVSIALTEAGADVIAAMQPKLVRFWDQQLADFTIFERDMLFSLLRRLRDNLGEGECDSVPNRSFA